MFNSNAPHTRYEALLLAAQLLLLLPTNLISAQTQPSAVPRLIKFSGTVNTAHETPRTGVVGLTFALYKDEQGGAPIWLETQNVQVDVTGHYTVELGATLPNGLPQALFASSEARWLGTQADGHAEQPRVLLLSVPYALKAADADTRRTSGFGFCAGGSRKRESRDAFCYCNCFDVAADAQCRGQRDRHGHYASD